MTGRELLEELKCRIRPQIPTPNDRWEDVLFHAGALQTLQTAERLLQDDEVGCYKEQLTVDWVTRRF